MTKIIKDINIIIRELERGNVAALPTETVYGLGANALNGNAVIKIFEIKERPKFNPLIVHLYDINEIDKYVKKIPNKLYLLLEKFSPGPITYVLSKKNIVPDIVTAGLDSVAIRFPSHKLFREVLREFNLPIAAPSANRFGRISPTTAEEVLKELNGKINFILDGGKCNIGIESTVISFMEDEVQLLRPGYVTKEEIEKTIGNVFDKKNDKIIAPGLLKSHYAPITPLYIVDDLEVAKQIKKNIGVLDLHKFNSPEEMALNLFSELRSLDEKNFDFIVVKKIINEGLGVAINDRLEKASYGNLKIENGEIIINTK